MKKKNLIAVIVTGVLVGFAGVFLMIKGNPGNMGFCIACFLRDIAGALKLHTAPVVQYARPEVIGIIFGSFLISLITREFRARGGSSPLTRFFLGFMVMIGALVFLGCPLRMVLRMAAGDLNAWIALIGFVIGVFMGTLFLRNGFSLGRTYAKNPLEGAIVPVLQIPLFIMLLVASPLLAFSEKGPGSMHASIWLALILSFAVGVIGQRSRICMAGGFRDVFMIKEFHLFWGNIAILGVALVYNLINSSSASPVNLSLTTSGSGISSACSLSGLDRFCSVGARCVNSSLREQAILTLQSPSSDLSPARRSHTTSAWLQAA